MVDVILIQPRMGDWEKLNKNPSLPLGLLAICCYLDTKFSIKIIDQRVEKDWRGILEKELKHNPLCVGVTSATGPQIEHALEVSRFVKEHSDALVVWGGSHASLLPGQTLESSFVDVVVKGEGEVTFFELVKALKKGKSLKGVKGVWYKKNGKIYSNPDRPFVDLNKLPELPYHLVDVEQYVQYNSFGRALDIETSRGCPNNCAFCFDTAMYSHKWRAMNVEKTFKQIRYLVTKFNLQYISFIDDYFFLDKNRVRKLIQKIIKSNLNFKWGVMGGHFREFDKLDKPFLKLLERSNCKWIAFGLESGSPKILKLVKKGITLDQVLRVNEKIKDIKITFTYAFMSGFPIETKQDLKQSINLLFNLKKTNPNLRFTTIISYVPFPGTELFQLSKKYGFKPPLDLEGWSKVSWGLDYENLELPWLSKKQRRELTALYFCSAFSDIKEEPSFFRSKPVLLLTWIYRPIARFRVKHLYFKFMPEMIVIDFFKNLTK